MATGFNIASMLECSVCMETYTNPKQLSCDHQYCKDCLDRLLQFNSNGSATIICPSRCEKKTLLTKNETTNDLPMAYGFKDILEAFQMGQQLLDVPPPPPAICSCTKDASTYCCGEFLCERCASQHHDTREQHEGNVKLVFDKLESDLKVMCREHMTICTHYCSSDNDFLCLYCLQRAHKHHEKYTIEEQLQKVKGALISDWHRAENLETVLKLSSNDIAERSKTLDEALRKRKTLCLSSYLDFLNREEQRIKDEYKKICEEHKLRYLVSYPKQYYTNNLAKSDIQLTVEINLILDKLSASGLRYSSLHHTNLSLSEKFTGSGSHPLGDLQVTTGEEVLFSDPPISTFSGIFTTEIDNYKAIVAKVTEDIKTLLQESNVINGAISSEVDKVSISVNDLAKTNVIAKSTVRTVVTKHRKTKQKTRERCSQETDGNISDCLKHLNEQGGEYVTTLIDRKENDKLELLLMARPAVATMKLGSRKRTPFLLASSTSNLDLMKVLAKYEYGDPVADRDNMGNTSLHCAIQFSAAECAKWLVQNRPTLLNVVNDGGETPLHYAARYDRLDSLKLLLNYGADINVKSSAGRTAFDTAQLWGNYSCAVELTRWSR